MPFPLPFAPRRIVIGASRHAALAAWIRERRPELEVRSGGLADISSDDMEWGEAYVGFKRPLRASLGKVRWIHCTGAGVDAWLHPVEIDPAILLTRTPESFGPMIAEWAVARVLAFAQQLPDLARAQAERRWAPRDVGMVAGTQALVVGTGDVGRAVAGRLAALGCHVTGVSRTGRSDATAFRAVYPVSALAHLVGGARWIVLTVPITPATHRLFDREMLSRCGGAVLLNAGRGAVVEESALPEALEQGWLSGAALDVFEVEPLPEGSALWSDPRVIVSPHISGITTTEGAGQGFLECLGELEAGRLPKWVVDRARGY